MNKTIILSVPYLFGLDQCIEKSLISLGYNVINISYDERKTYYPTFLHRIKAWSYKLFLGRNKYKEYGKHCSSSLYIREIKNKLSSLNGNKADFALFFRANAYPQSLVKLVNQYANKSINYQWDGIDAIPDILEYMHFFDRFWVFDKRDVEKYSEYPLTHITNFYFDPHLLENRLGEYKDISHDFNKNIYFLGGHQSNRVNQIKRFIEKAKALELSLDFYIVAKDDRAKLAFDNDSVINYVNSNQAFTFEQNLLKVKGCFAVVDFLNSVHQGLSFRTFDALCFDKKLITTNSSILEYDFYHPNNILVWDENISSEELKRFLEKPYQILPREIKEKYSFSSWIKQVLYSN